VLPFQLKPLPLLATVTQPIPAPPKKNLYSIFASKTPSKFPTLTSLGEPRTASTKAHDSTGGPTPSGSKHPASGSKHPVNNSDVPSKDKTDTKTITMLATAPSTRVHGGGVDMVDMMDG